MHVFQRAWAWFVAALRSQSNVFVRAITILFVGVGVVLFLLPIALLYEMVTRLARDRLEPAARWAIAALMFAVVVIVLGALGDRGQVATASPAAMPSLRATPTSRPTPVPTPKPVPSPTAVATPTPVPTPQPTPAPAFADIFLSGTGDSVPGFTIPEDSAAIAVITHSGGSNFAVWTVAVDGSYNDLLVNEIGGYAGTVLFDAVTGEHSVAFEITADGAWAITIKPVTAARMWDGASPLNGSGDDVVRISPSISGFETVTIQHTGSSNFAVWAYRSSGTDLLVNEIGPYLGEHLLGSGTFLLEVTADGAWTFAPS